MLKLAIVRINDDDSNEIEILIGHDLKPELEAAVLATTGWGARKRSVKRVLRAYDKVVNDVKASTVRLP